jgi:hypothetical protein
MESRQKVTQTTSISSTSWYAETHGADLSNQTLGIFTKIRVFDKLGDVTWSNYQRLITVNRPAISKQVINQQQKCKFKHQ